VVRKALKELAACPALGRLWEMDVLREEPLVLVFHELPILSDQIYDVILHGDKAMCGVLLPLIPFFGRKLDSQRAHEQLPP
jgi:hypothetical protein